MRFTLRAHEEILLELPGQTLRLAAAPHPQFPSHDLAHASSGKCSVVYHLVDAVRRLDYALKIFTEAGRRESQRILATSDFLRSLRDIEGLTCCDRICLTPVNASKVIEKYPAMAYANLMPWLEGTTWFDVHQRHPTVRTLTRWQCLQLATSFAGVLAKLERQGIAHCDLSPANVMVDTAPARMRVELLGIEDVWARHLDDTGRHREPSPEYLHPAQTAPGLDSDRFPGALLIAEMLAWHSCELTNDFGEHLFTVEELSERSSSKLPQLQAALERHSKILWQVFLRAWGSRAPEDCPSLEEWHTTLHRVGKEKIEYAWLRLPAPAPRVGLGLSQAAGSGK